jgi:hypothetical protein
MLFSAAVAPIASIFPPFAGTRGAFPEQCPRDKAGGAGAQTESREVREGVKEGARERERRGRALLRVRVTVIAGTGLDWRRAGGQGDSCSAVIGVSA